MRARSAHGDPGTGPSLTEAMRTWRAAPPQATFAEIEVEATCQVAALRAELIATAVAAGEPVVAPVGAACGRGMGRNGTRPRTITTSQAERLTLTGARYRWPACGVALFPPG